MASATPAQARLASLYMELLTLSGQETGLVVGPTKYETPKDVEEGAPQEIGVSFSYPGEPGRVEFRTKADSPEARLTIWPTDEPEKWIRTGLPVDLREGYRWGKADKRDAATVAGLIGERITAQLDKLAE